nr:proline-rich protein HaeIII subfamily 1-like [Camelus dromedarius]
MRRRPPPQLREARGTPPRRRRRPPPSAAPEERTGQPPSSPICPRGRSAAALPPGGPRPAPAPSGLADQTSWTGRRLAGTPPRPRRARCGRRALGPSGNWLSSPLHLLGPLPSRRDSGTPPLRNFFTPTRGRGPRRPRSGSGFPPLLFRRERGRVRRAAEARAWPGGPPCMALRSGAGCFGPVWRRCRGSGRLAPALEQPPVPVRLLARARARPPLPRQPPRVGPAVASPRRGPPPASPPPASPLLLCFVLFPAAALQL